MKNLLNNFFEHAVEENIITVNPILKVKIAPNRREENAYNEKKGQALHPEIRKAVLEWVEENPVLKPILILCTLRGLRPQEVITLKWENVNFNSKKLSIKTALNRVVEFDDDWNVVSRGAVRGKTKTPKSNRTFTMPGTVVESLREWKQYCHQKGLKSEFVFPNTKTGEMRTYAGLRSLFRRFMEKHNLQGMGTLYTLRHTFATILLEQRENPKIVMELMGHTKVKTTLDLYSHVVDDSVYEQTDQTLDDYYTALTKKGSTNAEAV
jgi:integrase